MDRTRSTGRRVRVGSAADGQGADSTASGARGQTTFDFALGMSIFLLSLAFVLVFVPGMFDPFTAGTQEETVAVNRVADELAQRALGNATTPYELDAGCTRAFFAGGTGTGCEFSGATIEEQVGVEDRQRVNVTVTGNLSAATGPDVVCWDRATGSFVEERNCGADRVLLARGPNPGSSGSKTISATRIVSLAGADVTIEVEMW